MIEILSSDRPASGSATEPLDRVSISRVTRIAILVFALCLQTAVYFVPGVLPDRFYWDAEKVQDSMTMDEFGDSFVRTAQIYNLLPPRIFWAVVFVLNVAYLWVIVTGTRPRVIDLAFLAATTVCTIPLNLLAPTKDTIVIALTLFTAVALTVAGRSGTRWVGPLAITSMALSYLAYGLLIRTYFLVAFVAAAAIYAVRLLPNWWIRLAAVLLLMVAAYFVSSHLVPGQLNRDAANDHAIINRGNYNRTLFYNPVPNPNTAGDFAVNYVYAAVRFLAPTLWNRSPAEFFLLVYVWGYVALSLQVLRRGPLKFCGALAVGHLLVLIIFDPDSGAFLRHLSSYAAYPILGRGLESEDRESSS